VSSRARYSSAVATRGDVNVTASGGAVHKEINKLPELTRRNGDCNETTNQECETEPRMRTHNELKARHTSCCHETVSDRLHLGCFHREDVPDNLGKSQRKRSLVKFTSLATATRCEVIFDAISRRFSGREGARGISCRKKQYSGPKAKMKTRNSTNHLSAHDGVEILPIAAEHMLHKMRA
jgi:hypothetical protein